jgi:L-arabinose isomerase
MEDYTYHLDPKGAKVLGAHMLEVCPTIAEGRPRLEVHPLSIGGKADPARLVFTAGAGPGIVAAVTDMGNRFRLVANVIDVVPPDQDLPRLPVARALWVPRPGLEIAAAAWIYAGSSHHTAFSRALTSEHLQAFADMADVELALIDEETRLREFRNELRWNEAYYTLRSGA